MLLNSIMIIDTRLDLVKEALVKQKFTLLVKQKFTLLEKQFTVLRIWITDLN